VILLTPAIFACPLPEVPLSAGEGELSQTLAVLEVLVIAGKNDAGSADPGRELASLEPATVPAEVVALARRLRQLDCAALAGEAPAAKEYAAVTEQARKLVTTLSEPPKPRPPAREPKTPPPAPVAPAPIAPVAPAPVAPVARVPPPTPVAPPPPPPPPAPVASRPPAPLPPAPVAEPPAPARAPLPPPVFSDAARSRSRPLYSKKDARQEVILGNIFLGFGAGLTFTAMAMTIDYGVKGHCGDCFYDTARGAELGFAGTLWVMGGLALIGGSTLVILGRKELKQAKLQATFGPGTVGLRGTW
jgi:hypothetical protein